jgi:hypothetical protein
MEHETMRLFDASTQSPNPEYWPMSGMVSYLDHEPYEWAKLTGHCSRGALSARYLPWLLQRLRPGAACRPQTYKAHLVRFRTPIDMSPYLDTPEAHDNPFVDGLAQALRIDQLCRRPADSHNNPFPPCDEHGWPYLQPHLVDTSSDRAKTQVASADSNTDPSYYYDRAKHFSRFMAAATAQIPSAAALEAQYRATMRTAQPISQPRDHQLTLAKLQSDGLTAAYPYENDGLGYTVEREQPVSSQPSGTFFGRMKSLLASLFTKRCK